MVHKSEIGKMGENIACNYLISKKYRIIERNFRKKWGELDIVAKDPANILVFAEVKTLQQQSGNCRIAGLEPEDNLTVAKYKKLKRTAGLYAGFNQNLLDEEKGWRIDLIAINLMDENRYSLNHYQNI